MRRLLPFLLATALMGQVPKSYHGTSGGWGPFDRNHPSHFIAGAACGLLPYVTAKWRGYEHPEWHSIFWAIVAGLVKENYDRHHGGRPEWGDVAYTGLGGALTGYAMRWGDKKKAEFAGIPTGGFQPGGPTQ